MFGRPDTTSSTPSLPPIAHDFLLFLGRVEGTITQLAEDPDEAIVRAKVAAYEKSLLDQLTRWQDWPGSAESKLNQSSSERFRSRIEDLMPALDRALEAKRLAAQPATESAPAQASNDGIPADPLAELNDLLPDGVGVEEEILPCVGTTVPDAIAEEVAAQRETERANEPSSSSTSGAVPWRNRGKSISKNTKGQMDQVLDEMADMGDIMKDMTTTWQETLKRDATNISKIADSQDKNLDDVTKHTKVGQEMLKRGQLGFMCTMIMVLTSIVIFFLMLPFIFWT